MCNTLLFNTLQSISSSSKHGPRGHNHGRRPMIHGPLGLGLCALVLLCHSIKPRGPSVSRIPVVPWGRVSLALAFVRGENNHTHAYTPLIPYSISHSPLYTSFIHCSLPYSDHFCISLHRLNTQKPLKTASNQCFCDPFGVFWI